MPQPELTREWYNAHIAKFGSTLCEPIREREQEGWENKVRILM